MRSCDIAGGYGIAEMNFGVIGRNGVTSALEHLIHSRLLRLLSHHGNSELGLERLDYGNRAKEIRVAIDPSNQRTGDRDEFCSQSKEPPEDFARNPTEDR
tara:strand:+ start:1914 stop:2213 length:300 start_codon:yes stop_codon:yes gene_type:complete